MGYQWEERSQIYKNLFAYTMFMSTLLKKRKREIIHTWIAGHTYYSQIPGTGVWFGQAVTCCRRRKARRHSDKKAGDLARI